MSGTSDQKLCRFRLTSSQTYSILKVSAFFKSPLLFAVGADRHDHRQAISPQISAAYKRNH